MVYHGIIAGNALFLCSKQVQPYPSDLTLETNLQNQTNWDAYKFMTVHSLVVNRMKLKQARA